MSYPLHLIVKSLSDDVIVANLNHINAELDTFAVVMGVDPDSHPDLANERSTRDALRAEYRTRTGEVI